MKFGVGKIAELSELLYEMTPPGGKVESVTSFKIGSETIKFKYEKNKPADPRAKEKQPEDRNQAEFDPNHTLSTLGKALSDKLMAIKPENADQMDSITTIGVDSVFFDFEISLRKTDELTEEKTPRNRDQNSKDEEKRKQNVFCKLESLFLFLLFFHYSFSFALQRLFLELEVTFP